MVFVLWSAADGNLIGIDVEIGRRSVRRPVTGREFATNQKFQRTISVGVVRE